MAKRQPHLASFWLGAVIFGLERRIIQMARPGTLPVDLHADASTNTLHSFIGAGVSPDALSGRRIRRSDECRILFISGSEKHNKPPICPWQPFGSIQLDDTDIEVKTHVHCRHNFVYDGWRWDLEDEGDAEDEGYNVGGMEMTHMLETSVVSQDLRLGSESETASIIATRSIFNWLRQDGWPIAEREIFNHPWLDFGAIDDEDSGEHESVGVSEATLHWEALGGLRRVDEWGASLEEK